MSRNSFSQGAALLISATLNLIALLPASAAVLPAGSTYAGQTLGEWSAEWWQAVLGTPVDSNPLDDPTGAFTQSFNNPSSPVFFLAGTFGSIASRSVTVTDEQAIFFPLVNAVDVNVAMQTADALRTEIKNFVPAVESLFATIDGTSIDESELFTHQEPSPVFSVALPNDNIFGLPTGVYQPAVSDGYWLMIEPLSPGEHTISFGGTVNPYDFCLETPGVPESDTCPENFDPISDPGFLQNNTYTITVVSVPESSHVPGILTFGALGVGSTLLRLQRLSKSTEETAKVG